MNNSSIAHKPNLRYRLRILLCLFLGAVSCAACANNQQTFNFYLPPQANNGSVIEKLISALNTAGLNNVNVKDLKQWQTYQQSVRHGHDGVFLSPPHFAAWLKHKQNFTPILKLKGKLSYVIVSNTDDIDIFEIRDLIERKTCTQAPLNLDYLLITQAFAKSVQTTETYIVDSVRKELNDKKSPCSAFSVSEHQLYKLEATQPGKYTRLIQGPRYSNYAISASSSLNEETLSQFKQFLKLPTTQLILEPLLVDVSSDLLFIDTNDDDYSESDATILEKYWLK